MKRRSLLFTVSILTAFIACSQNMKSPVFIPAPIDAKLVKENEIKLLKGPSVLIDDNKLVWGASVVEGDDGMYHMFFSTWDSGPNKLKFGDSWVLNSMIGYAVSKYPDRDFKFKKNILKGRRFDGITDAWDSQMVHNPHVKKFNNNYYLYYIGSYDPGHQLKGSPGENLNKRNRVQQSQTIGAIEFETFDDLLKGNFIRPDKPLLTPRTRVKNDNILDPSPAGTIALPDNIIVVNPSVVYHAADKKYFLYFKGNFYDPNWRGVHGVAISDSPIGPFKAKDNIIFDIRLPDGKIASAEDPYVWFDERNQLFYALVKDFSGAITGDEPGLAMLQSKDGLEWETTKNPFFMKKQVLLKGGTKIKVTHLERPQLLINEEGEPSVFYGACSIESLSKLYDTGTFNVHIPLIKKEEK